MPTSSSASMGQPAGSTLAAIMAASWSACAAEDKQRIFRKLRETNEWIEKELFKKFNSSGNGITYRSSRSRQCGLRPGASCKSSPHVSNDPRLVGDERKDESSLIRNTSFNTSSFRLSRRRNSS